MSDVLLLYAWTRLDGINLVLRELREGAKK